MAEVSNGKPYYGQLNGATFTTTKKVNVGNLYEVEIRNSSGNYKIKEKIFS